MKKLLVAVLGMALLGACAGSDERTRFDDDEVISRAIYRHDGPPALTLYTMINTHTGAGAHTSLMVNASQRVIFDPAGSVQHPKIAENADVLYGITPEIKEFYAGAHARESHYVVIQRAEVPAEVAEKALQLVRSNGAVSQVFCAQSTSRILKQLPGFETIWPTFYPTKLSKQFGMIPGVSTRTLREYDDADKSKAIAAFDETLATSN